MLIVSPAAVKFNWPWELSHFFGTRAAVCETQSPPKWEAGFEIPNKVTVINYDILKYWVPYLKTLGIKTVVADECQNLSNIKTQRTKAFKEVVRGVPNVLALSATPLTIRPQELFPVLNVLWPREFPAYIPFLTRYCDPKWTPWGMDYRGASNCEELHQRLVSLGMIRFRKKDVLKDLPDKVIRIVPVEMYDPDQYHDAKNDFKSWLKQNMAHRVRSASKAEALTKVGYMLRLTAKLKMKGIVEWANNFLDNTEEKLILFAIHHNAIDVMVRRIHHKHVVVDGSVTGVHRQNAIDKFQRDESTRAIYGNLQACGVGTTLTAASEVGICEYPWRPGDLTQAMDRPHRIGQKATVFINFFAAAGTIEEEMCKLIEKRQQSISAILDGGKGDGELNLHSELLRVLEESLL
jgi:SWI/SNF-related matrix-associated actin-dependent regulator 1 of chromatin subfamily A